MSSELLSSSEAKLDFDLSWKQLLALIMSRWRFLWRFDWPTFGLLRLEGVDVRRTNHGYHAILALDNRLAPRDMNFLQLALGSDVRRECLNFRRIVEMQMKSWNILYDLKFNNRGDITSREKPEPRLSKQISGLIKKYQKGVRFLE